MPDTFVFRFLVFAFLSIRVDVSRLPMIGTTAPQRSDEIYVPLKSILVGTILFFRLRHGPPYQARLAAQHHASTHTHPRASTSRTISTSQIHFPRRAVIEKIISATPATTTTTDRKSHFVFMLVLPWFARQQVALTFTQLSEAPEVP